MPTFICEGIYEFTVNYLLTQANKNKKKQIAEQMGGAEEERRCLSKYEMVRIMLSGSGKYSPYCDQTLYFSISFGDSMRNWLFSTGAIVYTS